MAELSQRVIPTPPPPIVRRENVSWGQCNEVYLDTQQPIKGDTNMGNLRTLNLTLVDNHPDLKAAEKIVFQSLNYVTEHTNDQTIQQVLMTGDVENALAKHNAKRAKVVDDAILRNTGRDVFLKPVEIWDLSWQVIQVA